MRLGEALGTALAGYRDKDTKRCATGLVAAVDALRELEGSNARLREAKDLFFRNAEAWEARALAAEAELARLQRVQ
jgi:cytolysin (calcineurin-like family phosphatase)